jgi:hypothetical protein
VTVACSEIVALAPLASVPRLQETGSEALQLPCDGVALTNCRPAGRSSVTTTLVADEGPALDTVIVYVMVLPVIAVVDPVLFVRVTAAAAGAAVTTGALPELLPALPSLVALDADAVFASEPVAPDATCTTSVNVAVAPLASVVALHVIVPVDPTEGVVHVNPAGVVIDRNSREDTSTSVITTLVAASGPLLVIVMV